MHMKKKHIGHLAPFPLFPSVCQQQPGGTDIGWSLVRGYCQQLHNATHMYKTWDFWDQVKTGCWVIKEVSRSMQRPEQHHPKHQPQPPSFARTKNWGKATSTSRWWPPGWVEQRKTPCKQWCLPQKMRSTREGAGPGYDYPLCCF